MSSNQRSQNGKHPETNLVTSKRACVAFHTAVPDGPGKCPAQRSFTKGRCSVPAMQREDWTMRAKCRGMQDALFPEASDQKRARLVCSGCPVRFECLAEDLDPAAYPLEVEALRRHANLMRVIEAEMRMMERFAAARPAVAQTQVQSLPTDVTDLATLRRVGALLSDKD